MKKDSSQITLPFLARCHLYDIYLFFLKKFIKNLKFEGLITFKQAKN